MKFRFLLLLSLSVVATTSAVRASILFMGDQNIAIPLDFNGRYLRIDTGATDTSLPSDWETAPWINPFFGGVDIWNSPLMRPVVDLTHADQIVNLAIGTSISSVSNFVAGESGSTASVGDNEGEFTLNSPGFIGFAFRTTPGGPDYFGWLEMELKTAPASTNIGSGIILAWAYESVSGTAIQVGDIGAVPEPGTALAGLAACGVCGLGLLRRMRQLGRRG